MNSVLPMLLERSVQFGAFTLASGATSEIYIDVRRLSLTGDGALALGHAFHALQQTHAPKARAIGGLTLGADPLVTATAIAAHLQGHSLAAIIVRKDAKAHGTRRQLEAPEGLQPGDEVVVVDDVITTAGSTMVAIQALRDAGFVVKTAFCVVDRESGGRERLADAGIELFAIATLSQLMEHRG